MKPEQHDYISKLRELAIELGRMPIRNEFVRKYGISKHRIEDLFGGFTAMVHSAGIRIEPKSKTDRSELAASAIKEHQEKINNSKNSRLDRQPEEKTNNDQQDHLPVCIIGDAHFPFVDEDVLSAVYAIVEKKQPKIIIQIGDVYDFFSFSSFPKSLNLFTPAEELRIARAGIEKMWATLKRLCPDARLIQMVGNHSMRPIKRLMEKAPELEPFFSIVSWFQFDGVETHLDPRETLKIGDALVHHGYKSGPGKHLTDFLANTIIGHTHKGGVVFRMVRNQDGTRRVIWELNVGLIGKIESAAFTYTPTSELGWTPGLGWWDELGPRFIPL